MRISFTRNSAGAPEITGTNNYYPFGLNHIGGGNISPFFNYHSYKFGSKELQETGMYDFGARMYMPDLGRWGVIDPLAEAMRRYSPYNYAFNNPISFIDPDGMAPLNQFRMMSDSRPDATSGWTNPNWLGRGSYGNIDYGETLAPGGGGGVYETDYETGYGTEYKGDAIADVLKALAAKTYDFSKFDFSQYGVDPPGNALSRFRDRTSNWIQDNIRGPLSAWLDSNTRNTFALDAAGQARMDDLRGQMAGYMQTNVGGSIRWATEHGLVGSGMGTGHVGAFEVNVDLMGGKYSKLKNYINFDIAAEKGIKDIVGNFGKYFSKGSVDNIVVNNPQATFLADVYSSLAKGGRITVRGTMSNKFFNSIWNGKANGLSEYRVLNKAEDVLNNGYLKSNGTPINGKINQIILQKIK